MAPHETGLVGQFGRRDNGDGKRMLIHVAGFNLGLLMRKRFGVGTPRGLQGRLAPAIAACVALMDAVYEMLRGTAVRPLRTAGRDQLDLARARNPRGMSVSAFTTGC